MENKALFKIGCGLYILTAKDGEKDNGCVTNTLMQITSAPSYRAVIAVNKQNYTHDIIAKTGEFNISVLTEETPFEVFKQFGFQSGRDTDKFDGISYVKRAENGIMYIADYANSYMTFKVRETKEFDTHTLFISEITDAKILSDKPGVTYSYYQSNIKPKKTTSEKKGWKCVICGYIYEGDELPSDFICPICKHGASDFVRI